MSDADTHRLSGVPSAPVARVRACYECSEPVPAERPTSVFCSLRCSNRNRKRRHREYETVTMEIDEATLDLRWQRGPIGPIGVAWGVLTHRDVAAALLEDARPRPHRKRRIPFPMRDRDDVTLEP